jgi:hypothetical protein
MTGPLFKRLTALERSAPQPGALRPSRIWLVGVNHDGTVTRGGCIVVRPPIKPSKGGAK